MDKSENVSERDTTGVKPLLLNRQDISTILVIAIVFWGCAFFLWWQAELDRWFLVSQNGIRTHELVVHTAQSATKCGMSFLLLVYLLYLWIASRHEKLREAYRVYLLVIFIFSFTGIGGDLLKEILNRPRPFVTYAGEINALSKADTPAFPSGHATKSMALALPFLIFITAKDKWHRGVKFLLAIITMSVCYSRVLLGAHYVSDVLAGIGLVFLCFPLVVMITNKMLSNMTERHLHSAIKKWALILFGLMILLAAM